MTKEIRKELAEAKNLYKAKKYDEALAVYERHYSENPESLNNWDKIFYCWSLYQMFIKDGEDEDIYRLVDLHDNLEAIEI